MYNSKLIVKIGCKYTILTKFTPSFYSMLDLFMALRFEKLLFGMQGHLHQNATPVAVKQIFIKNKQSITEFLNEVVVVTAIKHRNLVNLKGCCVREDQRLLVYEYLDNNDLAHHLFCKTTSF